MTRRSRFTEDVELGWRLNLFGHEVWFAPGAVVHHKHHGTSAWPEPPRIRLTAQFSRNLYALLDSDTLQRAVPAALLLAADRALLGTGLSRVAESSPIRPERLIRSVKAAFRARKISKATPISHAIRVSG